MQVGFHRRFDPNYRAAREKISRGHIGEVYLFRTSLRDMRSPGFDYIKGSGGFFADVTVHDFDAARWLVGEIAEVTAVGAALSDPGFEEAGDIDNAVITLRFEDGYRCQAVLDAVERSMESREWATPEIERTRGGIHGEV